MDIKWILKFETKLILNGMKMKQKFNGYMIYEYEFNVNVKHIYSTKS
jgi:hypothetical protein